MYVNFGGSFGDSFSRLGSPPRVFPPLRSVEHTQSSCSAFPVETRPPALTESTTALPSR